MRSRKTVVLITALCLVAALGVYARTHWGGPLPLPPSGRSCTVRADGEVRLDPEQMANAATVAAVGIRRDLPERAIVIALATALQESKLRNLGVGDRDSLGLFQQRPSQGWGTPEQIRDPRYAAGRFYDALARVRHWQTLRVTDAAQAVQRSAYPEAYEKWANESTVLAQALLGNVTGAVACTVPGKPAIRGPAAAAALAKGLLLDWGNVRTVASGLVGLAVPVNDTRDGWQYAHWLVAHAADNGVERVSFADLQWNARQGTWSAAPAAGDSRVVAEVFGDR